MKAARILAILLILASLAMAALACTQPVITGAAAAAATANARATFGAGEFNTQLTLRAALTPLPTLTQRP